MRTNKLDFDFQWNVTRWDNCLAYDDWKIVYVFTDISYKRYKKGEYDFKFRMGNYKDIKGNAKVVFVTNKQLMDFSMPYADKGFIQEVRNLVFDGKIGTRYKSRSKSCHSSGTYFSCLRSDNLHIQPDDN